MTWLSGGQRASNGKDKGIQMRTSYRLALILWALCLVLAACSTGDGEASPTPEPETVLTAAAETAAAQMTQNANSGITSTAVPGPGESEPGVTQETPSTTETIPEISTPQPTPITGGIDQAEFWADVTIPDGTDFTPKENFTKVWKLRNSGTNTWTSEYALAFYNGDQMSAPDAVPITANVPPGETIDIAVDMVAPDSNGNYLGYWKMLGPTGEYFEYAVYVQIDVVGGSQGDVTSAPTLSGSGEVSKVSIQVDDPAPDECPHTFTFTASFTLNEAATVSYRMEAGSDTPGFTYDLPGELTRTFDAGTHSVTYFLLIQDSVNGWAQFHVLSPNDKISNPTSFTLSCGS